MPFVLRNPTQLFSVFALVIFCWAFSWPISKLGLAYIPPIWFAALRLAFGSFFLFLFLGFARLLVFPSRRDLPMIFIMGILQVGSFVILITCGLADVEAGRAAILTYTSPLWILPISSLLFGERLNRTKLLGLVCGLIGIILLFCPWNFNWASPAALIGNALLIIAAWSWSAALLFARHGKWYSAPIHLIPWQLLVGTIQALILAFIFQPHPLIAWNLPLWLSLLYNGLFATAIGYLGVVMVIKELPAMTTALGLLAVPVLGLIFSSAMLDNPLTYGELFAVVLVIAGLASVALGARQRIQ